ncbi:MAG: DUF559 domain-containing protein [Oscillospiraceae bacterium]|nr:DUF559 domain-containing protein [Oscillospiraceae bacterium]
MKCYHCGSNIDNPTKRQRDSFHRCGRAYCNKQCSSAASSIMSSKRMAETNRKYAAVISQRMKTDNPMNCPEVRRKMAATLNRIGHAPVVRGGNGAGMTRCQEVFLEKVGKNIARPEYAISLGRHESGYPTNYKVDIAIPDHKIAVEIDGASHGLIERQRQDVKKDEKLASLGWKVFRFTNDDVDENVDFCVRLVSAEIRRRGRVINND